MTTHFDVTNPSHLHCRLDFVSRSDFFPLLEIMVSRMVTSYGSQAAQANKELPLESSLNLTLTQHPCDEEPKPREVRTCFEVEPPRAWYYHISPNSRILVTLL
jgi:hypothetical protein